MKWEVDTGKYANGEVLLLGARQVGGAHYDGTVARGSRDKYRATCSLPGVGALGLFPSREEAKTRVVQAVGAWLLHANLKVAGSTTTLEGVLAQVDDTLERLFDPGWRPCDLHPDDREMLEDLHQKVKKVRS